MFFLLRYLMGTSIEGISKTLTLQMKMMILRSSLESQEKNPKAEPVKTGAVAADVVKIVPGKLERDGGNTLMGKGKKDKDKSFSNKEKGNSDENRNNDENP